MLETLQPPDGPYLFERLAHGPGRHHGRGHVALTTGQTNENLNHFIAWVNRYCAAHKRPDAIPPVNGRVFCLHAARFRRTLAWFIARRPGGTIAGALQYRHHSIQVFEATQAPATPVSTPRSKASRPSPGASIFWPSSTPTSTPAWPARPPPKRPGA